MEVFNEIIPEGGIIKYIDDYKRNRTGKEIMEELSEHYEGRMCKLVGNNEERLRHYHSFKDQEDLIYVKENNEHSRLSSEEGRITDIILDWFFMRERVREDMDDDDILEELVRECSSRLFTARASLKIYRYMKNLFDNVLELNNEELENFIEYFDGPNY